MAIEIEFFGITGMIGPGSNDIIFLRHPPTTGPNGLYDITVDPVDGPAQRYGIDYGVTHYSGFTAALSLDLVNSDIKDVMNNYEVHGITGVLYLRVVYNY